MGDSPDPFRLIEPFERDFASGLESEPFTFGQLADAVSNEDLTCVSKVT